METTHDENGISIDLSPEEAETLTLFLSGHIGDPREPPVQALRLALVEYVNPRLTYHQRVADLRGTPNRIGKRLHTSERLAINALHDVAAQWPQTLRLVSVDDSVIVSRRGASGEAGTLARIELGKKA